MTPTGYRLLARGLGASPGVATGSIVFDADDAVAQAARGVPVILVRLEASAEDVGGMKVAAGILSVRSGLTGDAAIVARALGKPCVTGCSAIAVRYTEGTMSVLVEGENGAKSEHVTLAKGDPIAIDGASGEIYAQATPRA